jgi:hypothetical protein
MEKVGNTHFHKNLATFFASKPIYLDKPTKKKPNTRKLVEQPWQHLKANEQKKLYLVLKNLNFASSIVKINEYDFLQYWASLQEKNSFSIKKAYAAIFSNLDKYIDYLGFLQTLFDYSGLQDESITILEVLVKTYKQEKNQKKLNKYIGPYAKGLFLTNKPFQDLMNGFGVSYESLIQHKSVKLLKEHEELCRYLNDDEGLQICLGNQSQIFMMSQQMGLAEKLLYEMIDLCRRLHNKDGLQRAFGNLALIKNQFFNEDEAINLLKEQEEICRIIGNKIDLISCLANQADYHIEQGNIFLAIEKLNEQLKISRMIGVKYMIAISTGHMASAYFKMGEKEKSLKYYQEQEILYRELKDKEGIKKSVGNQIFINTGRAPTKFEMDQSVNEIK